MRKRPRNKLTLNRLTIANLDAVHMPAAGDSWETHPCSLTVLVTYCGGCGPRTPNTIPSYDAPCNDADDYSRRLGCPL